MEVELHNCSSGLLVQWSTAQLGRVTSSRVLDSQLLAAGRGVTRHYYLLATYGVDLDPSFQLP